MTSAYGRWFGVSGLIRGRGPVGMVLTLAAGLALAGFSEHRQARPETGHGWRAVPMSAQAMVDRTLGSTEQRFWVRRSGRRLVMTGSGTEAGFSRRGPDLRTGAAALAVQGGARVH